jgi:hypothetical protein
MATAQQTVADELIEERREELPAEEAPEARGTRRSCPVYLRNDSGQKIYDVKFTHKSSGVQNIEYDVSEIDDKVKKFAFTALYETGAGSSFDYWYIEFYTYRGGARYHCKDNFYCSMTAEDQGLDVVASFSLDNLHIGMPKSNSCDVSIYT